MELEQIKQIQAAHEREGARNQDGDIQGVPPTIMQPNYTMLWRFWQWLLTTQPKQNRLELSDSNDTQTLQNSKYSMVKDGKSM